MDIRERADGQIRILHVTGKVTRADGERVLRARIEDLSDRGYNRIVLNLAEVPYMDSSGLGELVRCYSSLRRESGTMALTHLSPRIVDMLRITKLGEVFDTFDTDADAVLALSARES